MSYTQELELLRALLRASDYGVLLSDTQRQDRVCNAKFCEIFGLDPEETIDAPPEIVRSLVLPRLENPEQFLATLDLIYSDPKMSCEDELVLRGTPAVVIRRFSAPVIDDNGAVIGRVWTFLDITKTRRLENKVKAQASQLKEQARALAAALRTTTGKLNSTESALTQTQQMLIESEKLSAIGILAASVAHDIRNILTPLSLELELADDNDPDIRNESLASIRSQIDRLSMLTHSLLALAKPNVRRTKIVNIAEIVDRAVGLLSNMARQSGVTIDSHVRKSDDMVNGDPDQLDQVLINLMLNAIQAMPDGGCLTISVGHSLNGISINIKDTGPGIPLQVKKRLFNPLFSTKPDGAGLGLYSSKQIVIGHGGTMRVQSSIGNGTVFTICLPRIGQT